ncbi:MAG: LysM peptidoglycan-binding domain-containing protein [Clostridia bacterium]|nr:LysM peptidoglycan-binding domain-containing protein [Clostridia bacterium]
MSPTVKNNWSFIKGSTTVKKEAPAQPEVKVEPAAPSKTETAIKPEPKVEAAPQSETVYVVKAGDCLSVIGKKFNVSYMEIAKINKIKNVNLIFVGQKLIIPAK